MKNQTLRLSCLLMGGFLSLSALSANTGELVEKRSVIKKALRCRVQKESLNPNEIERSVECMNSLLSQSLSSREKSGLINWFSSMKSIKEISECSKSKYNLETFKNFTPDFVCIESLDLKDEKQSYVLFFKKEKTGLHISSIYKPFNWKD